MVFDLAEASDLPKRWSFGKLAPDCSRFGIHYTIHYWKQKSMPILHTSFVITIRELGLRAVRKYAKVMVGLCSLKLWLYWKTKSSGYLNMAKQECRLLYDEKVEGTST